MNTTTTQPKRGFTLIELLVVIAIIGVLFAVAMPVFENAGRKDTDRAAAQVIGAMRLARQNAINKRQWTLVVFPTRDAAYTGDNLNKCQRSYAVLAATNNLDGTYQFSATQRDPKVSDMKLAFVSDWKYLPEGIYFNEDTTLKGNWIMGAPNGTQNTYTKVFRYPLDPAHPDTRPVPMGAMLFKPNGRAYVLYDSNASGKYWQDADSSKLYLTSAKYYEIAGGALSAPTDIPGTNTVVIIRNKTGQVAVWDGN
jgi:prepilin-type N-terminal cleavage/methylation domain-containing protein